MLFIIRDKETGNVIEEVETLDEAKETIAEYESIDKAEGNFTDDFYEIAIKLDNNDIVSLDNFDGYYAVELLEYYHNSDYHCTKIEHNIVESWNILETFDKEEAIEEAQYQLRRAEKYEGVILHHYTSDYRYGSFDEDNETMEYYKTIRVEFWVDNWYQSEIEVDCNCDLDELLKEFIIDFEEEEEANRDEDEPKKQHKYRLEIDDNVL